MTHRLALVLVSLSVTACDQGGPDLDPLSPELIDWRSLSQSRAALIGTWDLAAEVYYETRDGRPAVTLPGPSSRDVTWTFRPDGTATRTDGDGTATETTYRVARPESGDEPPLLFLQGC